MSAAETARAEFLRFGGYVEPDEPGWDPLLEATIAGPAVPPEVAERLEEATAAAQADLDRLLGEVHAWAGELLAADLDAAIGALRDAERAVWRRAWLGAVQRTGGARQ